MTYYCQRQSPLYGNVQVPTPTRFSIPREISMKLSFNSYQMYQPTHQGPLYQVHLIVYMEQIYEAIKSILSMKY